MSVKGRRRQFRVISLYGNQGSLLARQQLYHEQVTMPLFSCH
jgi:hypothetical protein